MLDGSNIGLIAGLLNIVVGVLIIAFPPLLRWFIGGYLILSGMIALLLYV